MIISIECESDFWFQIGLITFADEAKLEFYMNEFTTKTEILNNLKARYTGGKTNTAGAIS